MNAIYEDANQCNQFIRYTGDLLFDGYANLYPRKKNPVNEVASAANEIYSTILFYAAAKQKLLPEAIGLPADVNINEPKWEVAKFYYGFWRGIPMEQATRLYCEKINIYMTQHLLKMKDSKFVLTIDFTCHCEEISDVLRELVKKFLDRKDTIKSREIKKLF